MCKKERQQQETSEEIITVDDLIEMVEEAVTTSTGFIRDFCLKQVERLVQILRKQYQYTGALKRKILDTLGELSELSLDQRREAFQLVESYLI